MEKLKNILLLSKNLDLINSLQKIFLQEYKEEYILTTISDPDLAIDIVWNKKADILIISSNLAPMNAFEVVGILKKNEPTSAIPIIILDHNGENTAENELKTMQMGATDFIKYPFTPEVLPLKIKHIIDQVESSALLTGSEKGEYLKSENIELDMSTHTAYVSQKPLILTPKEFALLYLFVKKKNKVLNRVFLSETIWEQEYSTTSHTIDRHIANLRKKLGKEGKRIETLPTIGYKFVEH